MNGVSGLLWPRRGVFLSLCVLGMLGDPVSSDAGSVTFPDFSNPAGLVLNGNAQTVVTGDGTVLRLVEAATYRSGSAFSTTPINAATFSTHFQFRITNPGGSLDGSNALPGADGLVFVIQSVSSSIGGQGGGIGYEGISPSVGVEFDTWRNAYNHDPSSNHVGMDINGGVDHGDGAPFTQMVEPRFDDGNVWDVWIDYDGNLLELRTNQTGDRPDAALLTRALDLTSILGQSAGYVGFTSGTGADYGNHDILNWQYNDFYSPIGGTTPEPQSIVLALLGMGVFLPRLKGLIGTSGRRSS